MSIFEDFIFNVCVLIITTPKNHQRKYNWRTQEAPRSLPAPTHPAPPLFFKDIAFENPWS